MKLADKLTQVSDHWHPRIIARYNGNEVRIAKLSGAFVWHAHADTDELFLVLEGCLHLHFRDRVEVLEAGGLCVVPAGVEHKPVVPHGEAHVLLLDREGEPTTGTAVDPRGRTTLETL
ncbi:MAG: cupin domain-containing protein [Rhodothalassiaceae bacterium]